MVIRKGKIMSVKENVLLLLENNKNQALSGESIASHLGCTRASVWKAINALKDEGYKIDAVTNKGYTLKESADILSAPFISNKVKEAGFDIDIDVRKCVDSTNNVLKLMASSGFTKDFICISEEQTAGKGRRGRSFFSPKDTGLYISFLLHPDIPISEASMYTTVAATAEAIALENVANIPVSIKWVNDVWVNGKKISGILTEASTSIEDNSLEYIIVGIGINLYTPEGGFPDEIKDIAGSLLEGDSQIENLRNLVASELIIQFLKYYYTGLDKSDFLSEYTKRCFIIGKDVSLISPDHEKLSDETVHVLGINDKCHLHVRHADGKEEYLSAGEISVRI